MNMTNKQEVWKDVPSFPDVMASNWGRVWLKPMPNTKTMPSYGVEEKKATGRPGAPKRRIKSFKRLKRTLKVHQLVCEAFHGTKPFDSAIVIHIDENPSNNRPENLKWGTQKENLNMPKAKQCFASRTGDKSPRRIHRANGGAY